ncbi:hypothetical protein N7490_005417, partial [Penicillium lividum]
MASDRPKDVLHTVNIVTQALCIPIVTLFVALRVYTRVLFKQKMEIEDYFCGVAWLLFMGYCAIGIVLSFHGGGYHIDTLSDEQIEAFKKLCYIATTLYCPMALFVKIALLAILVRIFSPYRGKVWFIYIFLGCLCTYYVVALIVKINICNPIPRYWKGELVPGSCLDQKAALVADSVISVVSDSIILILPLPLTWSLQMPRNRKLRVIGLLGAGGLATGFSIYRLVLVLKDGSSADQSIVFIQVILSGNAEGGIGLICTCLPVLNLLIAHHCKNLSSNKSYNQSSDIQLGKRRSGTSIKPASEWTKSPAFGDQSHLISYADALEHNSPHAEDGIWKTISVLQTIETHTTGDPSASGA